MPQYYCTTHSKEKYHNIISHHTPKMNERMEYESCHSMLIAQLMKELNYHVTTKGSSYIQQYMLKKGLHIFTERGERASTKEMDQLHRCNCFTPVSMKEMTKEEKKKEMEALMFLDKIRQIHQGKDGI